MFLTRGIAAKIFGLALFLLALVILLAGLMLAAVSSAQREMDRLRQYEIPLKETITHMEESALHRRLAFERWFGALNVLPPNEAIVREASANYARYTREIDDHIRDARHILDNYPVDGRYAGEFGKLDVLLAELESGYPRVSARQQELIAMQLAGRHEEANARVNLLNDQMAASQRQRETMLAIIADVSSRVMNGFSQQQHNGKVLTIAATTAAVLLGLVIAAAITMRLTRPVRALTTAVQSVRDGHLDAQLPVSSTDEIGHLTETFNYFVSELRDKEHIKKTFGRYIDPRVLEQVLKNESGDIGAGERHPMTISFADIVGFTDLTERLNPTLMVLVLNRHFTLQAQAVQAQNGVVDKFIGDAILAFWGPPFVADADQVTLAVRAALAQQAAVDALNAELPELTGLRRDTPRISLRVGLAYGDVVVGNIGSESACSFTVIGDTVNLASRIEGVNRLYGTQVMMSEATATQLAGSFELREIDAIAVKGKHVATRVFELLGPTGDVPAARLALRDVYERALAAYRACEWDDAGEGFARCLGMAPDDGPSRLMADRVRLLRATPPAAGWDGVWHLDSK